MIFRAAILAAVLLTAGTQVEAACPNPLSTITIPLTGSVSVQICDQSGNPWLVHMQYTMVSTRLSL
jgi:hypothetical protein